jgi:hypothetical protein
MGATTKNQHTNIYYLWIWAVDCVLGEKGLKKDNDDDVKCMDNM